MTLMLAGCGCSETGAHGDADVSTDGQDTVDEDPWIPDGPCTGCDDGDQCTLDLCNVDTLECAHPPLDADGDGFVNSACGGDDCNDSDPTVYPDAQEICLDGVDQDCDGIIDGPMAMMADVRITETDTASLSARMVWTGSEFVLAWHELYTDAVHVEGVWLTRIDSEGEVVDTHVKMSSQSYYHGQLELVWNGARLGMIHDGHDPPGLTYLSIDPTGRELYSGLFSYWSGNAKLVWNGSKWGMASNAQPDGVYFAAFEEEDHRDLSLVHLMEDRAGWTTPGLTWTGSEFVMSWSELPDAMPMNHDIQIIRLSPEAELLSDAIQLTDAGISQEPRLAWTGSEIGLAFLSGRVYFTKLGPELSRLTSDIRISEFGSWHHSMVWTGSEFVVTWLEGPLDDAAVALAVLDDSGSPRWDPVHVAYPANEAEDTALVWTGSEFGVAWSDSRNDPDTDCRPLHESHIACNHEVYFNRVGFCE